MTSSSDSQGDRGLLERFSARRYCDVPFPAYRFTPGVNPHPTAHPEGHSYEGADFVPELVEHASPDEWRLCRAYLYGCDLYNHAYWWEAHEAWEALWKVTQKSSVQNQFLQGLIQTSACHLKRFVGHADGVARLERSSLEYLRSAWARLEHRVYMGLDVGSFMAQVEAYYAASGAARGTSCEHDPARYPYIALDPGA